MSDQNQYTTNEIYEGGSEMPNDKNVEKDVDFLIKKDQETQRKIQEINKYASEYYEYLGNQLSKINTKQKNINTKQDNLDEQQKEMASEMEKWKDDKVNLIEIVGIFVAIFTFVSVEIQILRGVDDYSRVAGLSVLLFSGLSFFLLALFFISENWVRKNNENEKYSLRYIISFGIFIILVIVSLAGGIYLVIKGDYNNPSSIKNNQNFIELKNKNTRLENRIDSLRLEVKEIKNNQRNKN